MWNPPNCCDCPSNNGEIRLLVVEDERGGGKGGGGGVRRVNGELMTVRKVWTKCPGYIAATPSGMARWETGKSDR